MNNTNNNSKNEEWVIWDSKWNFIKFVTISSFFIATLRLFLKFANVNLPIFQALEILLKELPEETLETLYNLAFLLTPFYLFVSKLRKFNSILKYCSIFLISVIAISLEKFLDHTFPIIDFGYSHNVTNEANNFLFYYIGDIVFYFIILILFGYLDSILSEKRKIFQNLLKREAEVNKLEVLKVQFELKSLQSQVNPHVLFNTLNTLSTLIKKEPALAQDLTINMASLYRFILGASKKEFWLIKDEMELINVYLNIESVRLGSRLNYKININKTAEEIKIPPLLIQPIVENSIKYGIASYINGGNILINISLVNSSLTICIKDQHMVDDMSSNSLIMGEKTGINNIKKRLQLVYGKDNANFDFKISENGATSKISIKLPDE